MLMQIFDFLIDCPTQVVPVKRKDLFKLLGLNDPLDIVDPTEVKLRHFRAIRQFSPATERGARIALHFEPNLAEDLCLSHRH